MNRRAIRLILALLVMLPACDRTSKGEAKFDSFKVERRNLVRTIEANGAVEMKGRVEVYAPVSGRLDKLLVKEGDEVQQGQRLAIMSSNTRASMIEMASEKGKKEKEYWEKQVLPTAVFAPVSGKILKIGIEVGDRISGSLMSLATGMLVRADIDEADLPKVKLGQRARITFDVAKSKPLIGEVTKIAGDSRTVNNVNVYQIEISWPKEALEKIPFDVKFGMSVTAHLEVEKRKDALALPATAVSGRSNSKVRVFDEKQKKLTLKLGAMYGDFVLVESGASEDQVVLVPSFSNPANQMRGTPFLNKKK